MANALAKILPANIGTVDRTLRVLLGFGLLGIAFFGPKTPWGYLGVIPLFTAFVGSCPLYTMFGLRTCPLQPAVK